jgi:hypothetical protein
MGPVQNGCESILPNFMEKEIQEKHLLKLV